MQVAWGRCHEGDGAPALWPWAQVVRQLAAELAPGQLAAMLGPSAAWLGPLIPELAGPAPPGGPPPIADLGAARFQLNALEAMRGPEPGPGEMAYHCWQAAPVIGVGRALPHLLRAGEQAVAQLAYEAADEQFERALELAGQLPASPQATEQEIYIAARLGTVRLVTHGFADPDAARALARARSLAVRAGRRGEPADGRWALFMSHLLRSELGPAGEFAAELVALGSGRDDPAILSSGHWQVGVVALHRGDLQEAQHHLEHALAASQDLAPGEPGDAPVDLTLVCQGYLGITRAYQGHADAALRLTGQAAGSARRLGDPFGLLYVLFCDAWAATVVEAVTRVLDSATEQAALIGKHRFRQWGIGPQVFQGWAQARWGDPRRGEQQIRAALAEMDATGLRGFRPFVLGLLAEAQLRVADIIPEYAQRGKQRVTVYHLLRHTGGAYSGFFQPPGMDVHAAPRRRE
jgi:tetratricopeptide (TPR) repeat protein